MNTKPFDDGAQIFNARSTSFSQSESMFAPSFHHSHHEHPAHS